MCFNLIYNGVKLFLLVFIFYLIFGEFLLNVSSADMEKNKVRVVFVFMELWFFET